jgi:hypothetical protein
MNERIKELIKLANGITYDDDGAELTPALVGKELEKFAELIVKECLFIIDDERKPDMVNRTELWHQIVEHFGVEE